MPVLQVFDESRMHGLPLGEQQMVAAIEAAPASASALAMIGAVLDAAVRFEEGREFARPRHRIIPPAENCGKNLYPERAGAPHPPPGYSR